MTVKPDGRRRYGQACNITRTLDLVVERWTLLLLRELFTGPRSYGQLSTALPGIGTNLLAGRLKQLEADQLIEKAPSQEIRSRLIYQLAERGRKLEPVLVEMVRFRALLGDVDRYGDFHRPAWAVLASRAAFRPDVAAGLTERYEFRVDDEVFFLGVKDGRPDTGIGNATNPVVIAEMTAGTFAKVQSRQMTMAQGVWVGDIRVVDGFSAALDRCEQIFSGT